MSVRRGGLSWSEVRAILDEFGIKYEVGPYGFTVRAPVMYGFRDSSDDWRVRCGSGIASRGDQWTIVRMCSDGKNDGGAFSGTCANKSSLRRALREHLANRELPHPDPLHPELYYASKHSTRFTGGHHIWKRKPRRTGP